MTILELFNLIKWDFKINKGLSWDSIRSKILLFEIRIEQFTHRNLYKSGKPLSFIWYLIRFSGSIFQWILCNSNIPGNAIIGRGLRLPHPQNIIILYTVNMGEFCTIYHNSTIAWNGFQAAKQNAPKIGNRVLIGTGTIIIGDIEIGSDVLIGAGTVVTRSIPDGSLVTSSTLDITPHHKIENSAEPGGERHIRDPYSIWR